MSRITHNIEIYVENMQGYATLEYHRLLDNGKIFYRFDRCIVHYPNKEIVNFLSGSLTYTKLSELCNAIGLKCTITKTYNNTQWSVM